jgi:hypothetical protein
VTPVAPLDSGEPVLDAPLVLPAPPLEPPLVCAPLPPAPEDAPDVAPLPAPAEFDAWHAARATASAKAHPPLAKRRGFGTP